MIIKEVDVEGPADESRDDIVEQLNAPAPSPPEPPAEPAQQKAECKMRMRELYKCDGCGKYLTKKSLNHSHSRTCKGLPENQAPKKQPPPAEKPYEEPYEEPPPPPQIPLYAQMQMEKRRAHLNKINRLSMLIA